MYMTGTLPNRVNWKTGKPDKACEFEAMSFNLGKKNEESEK